MYDVCWLRYDKEWHLLEATLLAEIEWGRRREIDEDFQKLLLGRARLKLMAFGGQSEDNKAIVEGLAEHLVRWQGQSFDVPEVYLLAGYGGLEDRFRYYRMDARAPLRT